MKKLVSLLLSVALLAGSLAGCGGTTSGSSTTPAAPNASESTSTAAPESAPAATPDTITALLPPISNTYLDRIPEIEAAFNKAYPHLTLKIEPASWEDRIQKLDTQVNAGSPPDIAFLDSNAISKYVDLGVAVNMNDYLTPEMLADFDKVPLSYLENGDGLYGLPAYLEIHGLGGNRAFLEAAGVDWRKIQKEGWTFEEFAKAAKAGTVTEHGKTRYGFLFACAGTTVMNYIDIFAKASGMPARFDENMKYAYTSKNMLAMLEGLRGMMDEGSAPKELGSITAGMRWNMFLTGQTMMTGKGLATFENMARQNNEKLTKKDGSAVADSIPVDYVVLPVPALNASITPYYYGAVDGYVMFRGKKEPTKEHLENVAKAVYFLASGELGAQANSELFSLPITKSGREAAAKFPIERDPDNHAAVERLNAMAAPARPDISPELLAKATKIETEVITPKFQALLANEITPQQMYDEIVKAATAAFGADGIVVD